jgi:hypothetical protein
MEHDYNYQGLERAAAHYDSGAVGRMGDDNIFPRSGELKRLRVGKRESQEKFWARFGVTQSSGSRFETGLGIPPPVALLIRLYMNGKLSDGDLLG